MEVYEACISRTCKHEVQASACVLLPMTRTGLFLLCHLEGASMRLCYTGVKHGQILCGISNPRGPTKE